MNQRSQQSVQPVTPDPGADEVYKEFQQVFYEPVKVRRGNGSVTKHRGSHYYDCLIKAGMEGDVSASKEVDRLCEYLVKSQSFDAPKPRCETSLRIEKQIKASNAIDWILQPLFWMEFYTIHHQLEAEYKRRHGDANGFECQAPYYLDRECEAKHMPRLTQCILDFRAKANRREGSIGGGYCQPPKHAQWKEKQSGNPSGRRKRPTGFVENFRKSLLARHLVLTSGRKTKLSSIAIIYRKLFERAGKGDVGARREIRTLIIALHKRDMLKPIPSKSQFRRVMKKFKKVFTSDVLAAFRNYARCKVKAGLEAAYAQVYGHDPEFQKNMKNELEGSANALDAVLMKRAATQP